MKKETMRSFRHTILTHPFEICICFISLLAIWNIVNVIITQPEVLEQSNHGLFSLSTGFLLIWCTIGAIGCLFMLLGLTMSPFSVKGMDLESAGLWMTTTMWLSAFVLTFYSDPFRFLSYGQYVVLATACSVRIMALSKIRHVAITASEVDEL